MKLFVWAEPYGVSYGSSMVFAVAKDEAAARKVIEKKSKAYSFVQYEKPPITGVELGAPTRVVDLPCAEWHHWEE